MQSLYTTVTRQPHLKVLFTDLFDTLLHRTVHPNYALKLWAKFLIRETEITLEADALFAIRMNAVAYLSKKQNLKDVEILYADLIEEVYKRLINNDIIIRLDLGTFSQKFQQADYRAETSIQFTNEKLIANLVKLKADGYPVYLITDFHLSHDLILKILSFHNIRELFDAIFVSSTIQKSKERGNLYEYVLSRTGYKGQEVLMIGDNKRSDIKNALDYNIQGYYLSHRSHKFRNKRNLFGNDRNSFTKKLKTLEQSCRKSNYPFSEYSIHFYFFIERLYKRIKDQNIKHVFFLAREGLYLKKLFDTYVELNQSAEKSEIQTHYLKISRQSAMLIALKALEEEDFKTLSNQFGTMSVDKFLSSFLFSKEIKTQIVGDVAAEPEKLVKDFVNSDVMQNLRNSTIFRTHYNRVRNEQKEAFLNYFNSFDAAPEENGITIVDVGWGGTMQENIHRFFNQEIPVTGYYLGLKEIYNIETGTKRFGLNFSFYPHHNYWDHILMANSHLYEQLLGAPHGSTLAYTKDPKKPTVEFYEENEKYVHHEHIAPIQDYMTIQFKQLFKILEPLSYTHNMVQEFITNLALRSGIFVDRKRLKFIHEISLGFYQNIGNNETGLKYDPKSLEYSKLDLIKAFIWSPEKVFRYLVKVKPHRYAQNKPTGSFLINPLYYYMRSNHIVKKICFKKNLLK